jgi:hypothetical protein
MNDAHEQNQSRNRSHSFTACSFSSGFLRAGWELPGAGLLASGAWDIGLEAPF